MGKQIKSTALTLDGSSMGAAPVSPTGTVRLRPKTDASALEVSYNGAAYVTLSGAGVGVPGSPVGTLQYNNAGAFGAVTGSSVSTSNVALVGTLTFDRTSTYAGAYSEILFRRENASASVLLNTEVVGAMTFHGRLAGGITQLGGIGAFWDSTFGGVLRLGAGDGTNARIDIKDTGAGVNSVSLIAAGGTHSVQVQQGGIILSTGSAGAIWYKESTDYLTALAIGASTQVLTVTDIGGGVPRPRWAAPSTTSGSAPGGSASELQYRAGPTTFGGIAGSAVSSANVTLVGDLTFDRTGVTYAGGYSTIIFRREEASAAVIPTGQPVGGMTFHGRLVTVGIVQLGAISSYWDNTTGGANNFGVLRLVARDGTASRIEIYDNAAGANGVSLIATNGSKSLQVQQGGIIIAGAGSPTTGAVYYRDSSGFVTEMQSVAGFLKSTGTNAVPAWSALAGSDIASGTVPLARGGTGQSLSDPGADKILFWDDSASAGAGAVTWLTIGSNLTIDGATNTINVTGSTAAGSTSELQYRNPSTGALQAVSGSTVSSIGDLTFTHPNATFTMIVNRTGSNLTDPAGVAARLAFTGTVGGVADTLLGAIRGLYESSNGGPTIDMGLSDAVRVQVGTGSTTIMASGYSVQVQTGGMIFTSAAIGTATGTIFYRNSGGSVAGLASATGFLKSTGSGVVPAYAALSGSDIASGTVALARGGTGSSLTDPNADRILFWDDSASAGAGAVDWLTVGSGLTITGTTITAAGGSGTPGGSSPQLQYNSSSSFGGVTDSSVSGANLTLGGYFQLVDGTSNSQEFFISATSAGRTRFVMRRYAADALGSYIQMDRGRGTQSSPVALNSGDRVGQILFAGQINIPPIPTLTLTQTGFIESYYETTFGEGTRLDIGAGAINDYARITMLDLHSTAGASVGGAITLFGTPSVYFQVQSAGFLFSSGSTGSVYYRDASGFFVPMASGTTSQFLKGGSAPAFAAITQADVSGTVSLAQGGTGAALTDPNADRIMFWDDSATAVMWLEAGSGLSISGTVMTSTLAGGSSLAGSVTLTDSTLTSLFTITFASTSDHKAVGGEVHMVIMAKQTSGSTQTQVYRRKVHFVVGKLATANTTAVDIRQDSGVGTNQVASFGGFSQIQHAVNSGSAVDMTTAITTGSLPEAITYKVLANSDLSVFSQFTCYFLVQYQGDSGITIA